MGYDSFFCEVTCPKCKKEGKVEFMTHILNQTYKIFNVGDKFVISNLEINYGEITDGAGSCPNCETHLKGTIRIVGGNFIGMRDIKIWEIKI